MKKIIIGVSSCLLGAKVRYDGGHKRDRFITDELGNFADFFPVCPETGCGLSIPREAMRLVGEKNNPRLVTQKSGIDHTERMEKWNRKILAKIEKEELCGFIFKSKSPSSGMGGVKVYNEKGNPVKGGTGIFARAFMLRFPLIPVEDEGRLHDAGLRENFIERLFVFSRWRELIKNNRTLGGLIKFHTQHKMIIMSHSQMALKRLGKLVAEGKSMFETDLFDNYVSQLMPALKLKATKKKNANVLLHIGGYFKEYLTGDEKKEFLEIIERYRNGYLPLVVVTTMAHHYVTKFSLPYLADQFYLNPHPYELMLRNHV